MPGVGHAAGVLYGFIHTTYFPEPLNVDCGPVPIPPGQIAELLRPSTGPLMATCRYTVSGSVEKWRAAATLIGASDFRLKEIIEAR